MIAASDAEFARGQRRYFQHEVDTYGVRTVQLTAIERSAYAALKKWPPEQRNAAMELLWQSGKLESGAIACHVSRRFAKTFTRADFKLFAGWIDAYSRNWAHTDGIGTWLLAGCIRNEPELRLKLVPWTRSRSRWKRRAAAVALMQEARAGHHTEFILDIASRLLPDRDPMVEKGVGWLLKETYPKRPKETMAFLLENQERASRLTLRYAAEKMTARDRAILLKLHPEDRPR